MTNMTTLDDENFLVDPATVSPWPVAIRYGLIGGLIYCIFTLVANMSGLATGGLGMVAASLSSLVALAIPVCLITLAVKHHRNNDLGGYITIGRVIIVGLVVTAVSLLISGGFNYLYTLVIDPGYIDTVVANTEEMMEASGWLNEEQLEQMLIDTRERMQPGNLMKATLVMILIFGLVVSSIIGLIMKKDPPRV